MRYEIINKDDNPFALFHLNKGEKIITERGSMVYMTPTVELSGKTGGIGKALARSITGGESLFMTTVTAHKDNSMIAVAPAALGTITSINVEPNNYWFLKDGVFLASENTVELKSKMQKKLSGALFGGTGGLFVLSAHGHGELLLETLGSLQEIDINGDEITIDTDHVVAWQDSLDYDIEVASGMFGFTSGEGLVTRFSGTGKVLVQSRSLKALASRISQYVITNNK